MDERQKRPTWCNSRRCARARGRTRRACVTSRKCPIHQCRDRTCKWAEKRCVLPRRRGNTSSLPGFDSTDRTGTANRIALLSPAKDKTKKIDERGPFGDDARFPWNVITWFVVKPVWSGRWIKMGRVCGSSNRPSKRRCRGSRCSRSYPRIPDR